MALLGRLLLKFCDVTFNFAKFSSKFFDFRFKSRSRSCFHCVHLFKHLGKILVDFAVVIALLLLDTVDFSLQIHIDVVNLSL